MNNIFFRIGSLNAATSIIISAIGGHKPWELDRKLTFNTAFNLHITSSIGMIISSYRTTNVAFLSATLFLIGSSLFSGVAYYRCFSNDKKFNRLMPSGGSMIILAWCLLALS